MIDRVPGADPRSAASSAPKRLLLWILVPAVLGSGTGIAVAMVPWSRHLLVFALIVSGLAWLLRVASDWFGEHLGPQRGVVMLGTILFGTWLVLAVASPGPLRGLGFGPLRVGSEPPDPYAIAPAGSRRPLSTLNDPSEPIDPVEPLKQLVTPEPVYPEPQRPTPPADGSRGTPRLVLRLSSSQSAPGEGLVLIAEARGDGRPVRGYVEFVADDRVVQTSQLRVQGDTSQIEYRLVGLPTGTHTLRVRYRGSPTFNPVDSEGVLHRVTGRHRER